MSYDTDGKLLNDTFNTYTWSAFGEVTAIGSETVTHDAFGRVAEYANGSTIRQLLYGPSGAKIARMNGQTLDTAWVPLPGGAIADYHSSGFNAYGYADWLGTTRLGSTSSRTKDADWAVAPYGEVYAGGNPSYGVFTGNGNFNVLNSKMWDFSMREEHSSQGRWISPDPAGLAAVDPTNPQTWNRYGYVAGFPLSAVDPAGLGPVLVSDGGFTLSMTVVLNDIGAPGEDITNGTIDVVGMSSFGSDCINPGCSPSLTARQDLGGAQWWKKLKAANNGTNPIVPANPCNRAGNAPDPSVYQAKGQAASTNEFRDLYYLFQFRAGGGLDAQPQGASPAYANYAYGVYMSAAGYTLDQALAGADIYAQYRSSYRPGTVMDPNHPFTPMVNVMNITYGFTAQQMGTICHK